MEARVVRGAAIIERVGRNPGCWLAVLTLACAAAPSAPSSLPASSPAPVRGAARPRAAATLMLLTEHPIALEAFRYERSPLVRVEAGVGYLDGTHARALATRDRVMRIPGPPDLQTVCVADDGRTTFAKSQKDYEAKLWRAPRFDAPLELLGTRPVDVGNGAGSQRARWVIQDDSGTVLVECEAGRVQRLGAPALTVSHLRWTDAVQLLRLGRDVKATDTCVLRTRGDDGFTELPSCYERVRADGSIAIEKMPPEAALKARSGQKPLPADCLLVVERDGTRLPCSFDVVPEVPAPASTRTERASLARARFYADGRAVAAGAERGLYVLGSGVDLRPENRIGAESLGLCLPLLAIEPVYWCDGDPDFDVVIRVGPDGKAVQELRRRRALEQHAGGRARARFHHTSDGGLAVGGDCEGRLTDAACVRDRGGVWHTVPFSTTLITALARTAPATRLVPTKNGRLFVGTGTATPGFGIRPAVGGEIQVLIFDAARGEPTSVKKLPAWIVEQLADLVDAPDVGSGEDRVGVSFIGDRRIRVWPLERKHPAFGNVEHCRVDITLEGGFETECTQGRLFAVGAFGLLQKQLGELYETLDSGGSWARVPLPPGLETDDITCSALGCRIGPYWRAGWGEPAR